MARAKQLPPPGDWVVWLNLAGRGFGKTRTGAEYVRGMVESGEWGRVALIAQKAAEYRDVMVEGESGILAVSPPWNRPVWEPSKRRLTWPNGAIATCYSAEEPDELRGPQHHGFWGDEPAKWKYPQQTHDNLMMGLRLGPSPRGMYSTTPKPTPFIKGLLADVESGRVVLTHGTTYENLENLSPAFQSVILKYEGTTLGRQELEAELLEDVDGALWKRAQIEAGRVVKAPEMSRIVVAVDPSTTANEESDECGIMVVGAGNCACKGELEEHYFVLDDLSLRALPGRWAAVTTAAYHDYLADSVIAEGNNGGQMITEVLHRVDDKLPVRIVTATRGKLVRAEPVSILYEQGKAHHVGAFPALEDEMCLWVPGSTSPNRMDALVWGMVGLGAASQGVFF